jgi:hypothetical protein
MTRRRADTPKADPREAILTSALLQRLEEHALGKVEMSSTEVRAAEILLKKRLADLASTAMTVQAETLEEMLAAIARRDAGIPEG